MTTRPQWHRNRSGTAARRCAGLRVESLEQRTMLAANILVSEVNYFPAVPTAAERENAAVTNESDFDFLEIYNADDVTVDLDGYEFTQGVSYIFPQVSINPGQFAVIVRNQSAFRLRYGDAPFVIGEFTSGSLNDSGERVKLVDQLNVELVDFDYDDTRPWPESPDGHGATLELIDPDNTPGDELDEFFRWRGSTEFGGSPGVRGAGAIGIIVNEILTHTDAPITLPDSIELFNSTDVSIDVGGWFLSDSFNFPLRFQIPSPTKIQPKDVDASDRVFIRNEEWDCDGTSNPPGWYFCGWYLGEALGSNFHGPFPTKSVAEEECTTHCCTVEPTRHCVTCGEPQFQSPSGPTCVNQHGGAESKEEQ